MTQSKFYDSKVTYDFNSHAHVERDDVDNYVRKLIDNFNSHAHVERDICSSTTGNLLAISTHTLTWSVTCTKWKLWGVSKYFNSHAHVERDYLFFNNWQSPRNFNSHAHVERDL